MRGRRWSCRCQIVRLASRRRWMRSGAGRRGARRGRGGGCWRRIGKRVGGHGEDVPSGFVGAGDVCGCESGERDGAGWEVVAEQFSAVQIDDGSVVALEFEPEGVEDGGVGVGGALCVAVAKPCGPRTGIILCSCARKSLDPQRGRWMVRKLFRSGAAGGKWADSDWLIFRRTFVVSFRENPLLSLCDFWCRARFGCAG